MFLVSPELKEDRRLRTEKVLEVRGERESTWDEDRLPWWLGW